jgi:hypothetical protein
MVGVNVLNPNFSQFSEKKNGVLFLKNKYYDQFFA